MADAFQINTPPKKSKLRTYILRGFIALFVLALLGGTVFSLVMKIKFADFQPPMSPANVIISPVSAYQFKDTIEAIGTITASESAMITATVTETIKAINAAEGQFVSKGTPIVDLSDDLLTFLLVVEPTDLGLVR